MKTYTALADLRFKGGKKVLAGKPVELEAPAAKILLDKGKIEEPKGGK